jgi:cyclase
MAEQLSIPLTVGGGIGTVEDVGRLLRAGADRVALNTAAVLNPELLTEAAGRYGSACIVAAIMARAERRQVEILARTDSPGTEVPGAAAPLSWFRIFTHGGETATNHDAVLWARQCAATGAGELLVTSLDRQGVRAGYDLELTARIVEAVPVSVIAGGDAGSVDHIRDAFLLAGADGALAASLVHDGATSVADIKHRLQLSGIAVRTAAEPELLQ